MKVAIAHNNNEETLKVVAKLKELLEEKKLSMMLNIQI